jgi:hypothetical protein
MRAEQKICGLRGNGPLDYLCSYKKFPIAVTEVKDENVQKGYAQNDAQLVASRQEYKFMLPALLVDDNDIQIQSKKRKYLQIDLTTIPSFGIVSSGLIWVIQKLVEGHNGVPSTLFKSNLMHINVIDGTEDEIREQIVKIVRYLVCILNTQKDVVNAHPYAHRVSQ